MVPFSSQQSESMRSRSDSRTVASLLGRSRKTQVGEISITMAGVGSILRIAMRRPLRRCTSPRDLWDPEAEPEGPVSILRISAPSCYWFRLGTRALDDSARPA